MAEEIKTIVVEEEKSMEGIAAGVEGEVEAQGNKVWIICGACGGRMWVYAPIRNGARVTCPHCRITTTYQAPGY